MVPRRPFQVQPPVEGVRESPPGQQVPVRDEGLADTDRNPRRRALKSAAMRPLSPGLTIVFGAFLTVVATGGLMTSVMLGFALMNQTERTLEVRENVEHIRALNGACQSELAVTRGELKRMDALLSYVRPR